MGWGFVWLMFVLKIPLAGALWIVWWAIHQETDPLEQAAEDDGGLKHPPHPPHPRRPLPGGPAPRRGRHGHPAPPSPPRVRTAAARARQLER
jgi:hypothetical protein